MFNLIAEQIIFTDLFPDSLLLTKTDRISTTIALVYGKV